MVATPLTPVELLQRADLAGCARVLANSNRLARIRFTKLLKGQLGGTGWLSVLNLRRWEVDVHLHPRLLNPVPGDWWDEDAYPVGATILTHLWWSQDGGCYETLWWNAVTIVKSRP